MDYNGDHVNVALGSNLGECREHSTCIGSVVSCRHACIDFIDHILCLF